MNIQLDSHDYIKKSIIKSQHCQRNWDLSKTIPQEDLDLIVHAVTQCPSKQNIAFYGIHLIQNREIIEKIHECTYGANINDTNTTNPQVLANLLIIFEDLSYETQVEKNSFIRRNLEGSVLSETISDIDISKEMAKKRLIRDKHVAIGVAAGYVNLVASLLGYNTGCCQCIDKSSEIIKLVGMTGHPLLLMGIGFKDSNRPRREHHLDKNIIFPAIKKQTIPVSYIN